MKQYPHYLFVVVSSTDSIQGEDGEWQESEPSTQFIAMCREETNGRGTAIQTADGKHYIFLSLVQLPKGTPKIEYGAQVYVSNDKDGLDIRVKGTVMNFDSGQLHSRLWV